MNDFKVKVVEGNGDVSIYTNATAIDIHDDRIVVDYDDGCRAIHDLDDADEVTIKRNA